MRLERYLLALYPRSWRARYEEEFVAMLEQCSFSWSDTLTIVHGALDAHLHPQLGTCGMSHPEKARLMLRTLRGSLLNIFYAYIGFIIVGCLFAKMTEDKLRQITSTSTLMESLYAIVLVNSLIALGAMLLGGLPVVLAIIQSAITTRRFKPVLLLTVPLFAFVALLLFIYMPRLPVPWLANQYCFAAFFLVDAFISTAAVSSAITRSEIPPDRLRFAARISTIVTIAMFLMLIGTLGWGLSMRASNPDLFLNYYSFINTNNINLWLFIIIGMTLATVVASIATLRGIRSSALLTTSN